MKYIYQHLGLGDSIICNGLIRNIIKREYLYSLFVYKHNKQSIEFMYKDIKNLFLIEVNSDNDVFTFILINNININNIINIGFIWVDKMLNFEKNFYLQNKIDFNEKWNSFYIDRDYEKEEILYNKYNINSDYIFVHDDDRFKINNIYLPNNVRIIKPIKGLTDNIFDYLLLIEKSISIHCIESSFAFMIDNLSMNNKNFTIHRYARNISSFETPIYKNVKKILI